MKQTQVLFVFLVAGLAVMTASRPSLAVKTLYIEHDTETDFKQGEPNQVVISSEGEIFLAQKCQTLLSGGNEWVVNDLLKGRDGSLYVATSGNGYIYRITEGQPPQIIYGEEKTDQKHIFSLAQDSQGRLLAGAGGQAGQLLRFDSAGRPETIFKREEIKYIWSIVVGPAGRIYLATGPTGKIFTLDSEGKDPQLLYQAKEKNILCLALDRDGILFAGGDENGLIYRIEPGSKKTTVVYDTRHSEISSLVFDEQGNLYAATADVSAARPGAKLILSDGGAGHAEEEAKEEQPDKMLKKSLPPDKSDKTGNDRSDDSDSASLEADNNQKTEIDKTAPSEPTDEESAKTELPLEKPQNQSQALIAPATQPSAIEKSIPALPGIAPRKPVQANEVYCISPEGYVLSLLSQSVIILAMDYAGDGQLLLATGNEGQLLQLDVDTRQALVLHTARPSAQVSAVLVGKDGTIYLGCANPAAVLTMESSYEPKGFYTSPALDAGQISTWGHIQIDAEIPQPTQLTLSTRTGNTADPDKGGWQDWTESVVAAEDIAVRSLAGRFLQYRLDFITDDKQISPLLKKVKLAHTIPNLPPILQSVKVTSSSEAPAVKARTIVRPAPKEDAHSDKLFTVEWQASDDNQDELSYKVFIREVGSSRWIQIAKDLKETKWQWNCLTAADGRYELKVEASDAPDNMTGQELTAARISQPFVVDNTPPAIPELIYTMEGNTLHFSARLSDRISVIGAVAFVIDSAEDWHMVLPVDLVFDSREEQVEFEYEIEEPGEHLLTIRFEDALGNRAYRNLTISIPQQ